MQSLNRPMAAHNSHAMFPNYQPPTNRVSELLDTLKKDFDSLAADVNRYKGQRDEYERKGMFFSTLYIHWRLERKSLMLDVGSTSPDH